MKALRLALSGSGFKFPAHVGALMAIRDAGFTPIEYAGTSGGSIVAALAASGMDLDTMKSLTMTRDWSDMLTFSVLSILGGKGFCSGDTLLDWITKTTNGATFDDLTVPLTIMASDASNESASSSVKRLQAPRRSLSPRGARHVSRWCTRLCHLAVRSCRTAGLSTISPPTSWSWTTCRASAFIW